MPPVDVHDEVIIGEIRTGLLRTAQAVSPATASKILEVAGEPARSWSRPVAYAISANSLVGVDCALPGKSAAKVHVVGTVSSRCTLTGGLVAQGSAFTRVHIGPDGFRRPWSYYLAKPGVVESLGKTDVAGLAEGFESERSIPYALDLGSIAHSALERLQSGVGKDQAAALKFQRTRFRWMVLRAKERSYPIRIRFGPDTLRTVVLPGRPEAAAELAAFCEDLAMHDWLLTTLLSLVSRSQLTGTRREAIAHLEPALDLLLHLWMPAARIQPGLMPLWRALRRRPGLVRQWHSTVSRIRDQLSLAIVRTQP